MALHKSKRYLRALLLRERGIDNDDDHHTVLYYLRLLDDDDDYELFRQMRLEDDELNLTPSAEQRAQSMRRLDTPNGTAVKDPNTTRTKTNKTRGRRK